LNGKEVLYGFREFQSVVLEEDEVRFFAMEIELNLSTSTNMSI